MKYLTSVDIQQKVNETGFDWRTVSSIFSKVNCCNANLL